MTANFGCEFQGRYTSSGTGMKNPMPSLIRGAVKLTVCTTLFLQGCTMVGPDYQKPDAPTIAEWIGPDNLRVTRQPVAQTEWWKIFNDPVLNRLVDKAYQQNLTLQAAGNARDFSERIRKSLPTPPQGLPSISAK